jgi:hypothetical protein
MRLRPALLALALLPLPLGACSSKSSGGAGTSSSAEALAPVPAPAGLAGDLLLATPGATWTRARGALGGAAMILPQGFGSVVATLLGLPITLGAEIDDAVPAVGAVARPPTGLQVALGVHVKAGDRLLDQLTRGESARFNALPDPTSHVTLLTDKVAPENARVALGILGNYLLVGRRPGDLYALGPYVVRTLGPRDPGAARDDLAIEMPEKALAGPILDEVRDLRQRTEGASAAIVPLPGMLDTGATLLGDASHGRFSLNIDAGASPTLQGRLVVTAKPGGAGSKLVADLAVGDIKPLLDLPDGTLLGLLWRESAATRAENAPKQAEALARFLGKDVTPDEKAAIMAALRAEAEARGDWQAMGITWNGTGPTAVVRAPVTGADAMKKALKGIVDLGDLAAFKKVLGSLGLKLLTEKAVVENLPADVVRVRLTHPDDDPKKDAKDKGEKKKASPEPPAPVPPGGTPKAIDLLYFVDGGGLFAAAGLDPKDSLRALTKAPSGPNLGGNTIMSGPLADLGGQVAFVLVADANRITALTGGPPSPGPGTPTVLAAGRSASAPELWGRFDLPASLVQQLVGEYFRRRGGQPAAPAP